MIYKEIQKKQKQVDPGKHDMRILEDNLTEENYAHTGFFGPYESLPQCI
jgi:hypothetical protein